MKQLCLVVVVVGTVALAACGKKDADRAPATGSGSGSAAAGSGSAAVVGAGSGSAVVVAAIDAAPAVADGPCAEPCRLLVDTDLPGVRGQCPDWSLGKDPAACEEIDFTRNCIYAASGYTFKKDRWKKAFGDRSWYKPDPAFKEAAMSKVARTNVGQLKQMAAACLAHNEDQISPETRAVVEAWFAARAKDGMLAPLPDKLSDPEGAAIPPAAFANEYLSSKRLFMKDPWEPIEWIEKRGKAEVVGVSTGIPDPKKCKGDGEDCEGFESIEFQVEDGKITGIDIFMSACPFVYEPDASGGWAYRGEILRNLATPAAEATRTLALAGTSCSATRTVRITEEKREVTYLDSVGLELDGVIVAPDACGAMCADDGRYHVLATGDALELTFTLPAASCAAGTLVANGYYVPVPVR